MTVRRQTPRADLVPARRDAAPLASRRDGPEEFERPDFDFTDMCVGFLFAANLSGGNVAGAIMTAAGFVAQKAVRQSLRRHAETTGRDGLGEIVSWLGDSVDQVVGALPTLDDINTFWRMPARQKLRFIAVGEAPAAPDLVGDDNGDGAAEGRTVRLAGQPGAPLDTASWLRTLNEQPDRCPHVLVTGPTGAGKTTLVAAALGHRDGQAVVISPKISPDGWRGAEVITLDDAGSYAPLAAALEDLEAEKRRRIVALRKGEPFAPLTVVLDELPELVAEIPAAGQFAVRLSRIGRELGMRLVVIATNDSALNVRGWATTQSNYVRVQLDRPADDGSRTARLDDGVSVYPLELSAVAQVAAQTTLAPWRYPAPVAVSQPPAAPAPRAEQPAALLTLPGRTARELAAQRAWEAVRRGDLSTYRAAYEEATQAPQPPAEEAPAPDFDLLGSLLATSVPSASGRQGNASAKDVPVPVPVPDSDGNGDRNTVRSDVTVTPGNGGDIHVHVRAEASAGGRSVGPRRRRHGRGINVKARRQRAFTQRRDERAEEYRQLGAEGVSWRKAYKQLGGSKDVVFPAWQAGRAARRKD